MDVPDTRQRNDFDCGPACVRAAIRAFGLIPLAVDSILKPHPVHGTPPDRMARCLARHGLYVTVYEDMTWNQLRAACERSVVLAPIQLHGEGHWVVVKSATEKQVSLMDPFPQPVAAMSRWSFESVWRDEYPPGVWLDHFAIEVSNGSQLQHAATH